MYLRRYHLIDLIAELFDNSGQACWEGSQQPKIQLVLDVVNKVSPPAAPCCSSSDYPYVFAYSDSTSDWHIHLKLQIAHVDHHIFALASS